MKFLIKRPKVFVLLLIFLMTLTMMAISSDSAMVLKKAEQSSDSVNLKELLVKAAAYADRLEASVFFYVCREEIKEWIDPRLEANLSISVEYSWTGSDPLVRRHVSRLRAKRIKKSYVYDYQCIRKEGKIQEQRTLLEEDGKTKNEPGVSLKTSVFLYATNMMGPVGLFGARFQSDYEYTIVGGEKKKRRKVVIVEAKPKLDDPTSTNLYGKAWLFADTGDILKIEWNEKRIGHFEIFEERGKQFERIPRIKVRSEFEVEKNGLRFPSRLFIEEAYSTEHGRAFVRSKTTVEYKDFKFFTVDVEIK